MKKVAKFYKVSYEQYKKDLLKVFGCELDEDFIKKTYNDIKLPIRATTGSAGYDFFMPYTIIVEPGTSLIIPTGIRCKMNEEWVLKEYPRSGHGFKYGIHMANTVGVIDSDYFYSDNEGHIMIKLVNDSILSKSILLTKGEGFCQGIFCEYGITVDDYVTEKRNGGFGSTTKNRM